ncbi:MAG: succinate dehydrogenase [Oscillospiraceae bacterium]|nr:succinate dehydrogenase [Oscillospiraceae bacterium]
MWIDVLRRESGAATPYLQRFLYEPEEETETVATALTRLNERADLRDATGAAAEPIRWACSCLQKKCGACAMVIDGVPRLACDARLSSFKRGVRLEPLRKFPVVADLIVDRSVLRENLAAMRVWFNSDAAMHSRAAAVGYEASRCLQCGCCLEVCPNFAPGGRFVGMAAALPVTRLLAELPAAEQAELAALYRERVFEGCGKSLACRTICPAEIDIDAMLVNSNAVAVWKRLLRNVDKPRKK